MLKLYFIFFLTSILFGSDTTEPNNNSLIIYDNIALVHEKSFIHIKKSNKKILYSNVASSIISDSVHIELPDFVTIYSQQYRFNKLTKSKLLQAFTNKEIFIKDKKAILLSCQNDSCLVKTEKKQIISIDSNEIIFTKIPNKFITKPSLIWNIQATKDIDSFMEIDYLIKDIGFTSKYILNLKNDKADITGWLNIDNRSGKDFKQTNLFVLAGDIKQEAKPMMLYQSSRNLKTMSNNLEVKQLSYEGYHLYKIPFKVNLANNEKTQIKFLTKNDIDIKRKYKSTMSNPLYFYGEKKHKVMQYIHIDKLDEALPKGLIRIYSKLDNQTIFLGENRVKHTPKNIPLDIEIGNNFDITVKEQIKQRTDTKAYSDIDIVYKITNSSSKDKKLEILIPFNQNKVYKIKTYKKYRVIKGRYIVFDISIKANSSKKFEVNYKHNKTL